MSCSPAVAGVFRWRRLVVLVADPHIISAMKCGRRTRSRDHRADNIGVPDCSRAASPNTQVSESLSVVLDGQPVQALEISGVQ